MSDDTPRPEDLTEEELAAQRAEELPDRQAMSIVTPGIERPMPLDGTEEIGPPPQTL